MTMSATVRPSGGFFDAVLAPRERLPVGQPAIGGSPTGASFVAFAC
jgi:hypothetical protein